MYKYVKAADKPTEYFVQSYFQDDSGIAYDIERSDTFENYDEAEEEYQYKCSESDFINIVESDELSKYVVELWSSDELDPIEYEEFEIN